MTEKEGEIVRIKKTRILVRSVRAEAFRTIQYLIPAGSENVRMVRKLQNFMQNQKLKELPKMHAKSNRRYDEVNKHTMV